nr:ABC transporter ATP-binding protein [uncultured Oscillibacter sp.]
MGNTIIRTTGLTKRYDEITAVNELNLEINQGEVFGLLGPNGAGKTTTTLMLLGLTEPTSGTAFIDGHDCTRDPLAVKGIVGYLPDSVGFYPELTGRENLRFTGQLNGLDRETCEERVASLLERVGMTYAADRRTGGYSRGMKQRLGIADVLMKDPKVIIMDEPTLGIDPEGMRELIALIRELSVRDGRTILISSHQLYQIQQICDRVGIFVKGKLIACGRIDELGQQLQNEGLYILDLRVEEPDQRLQKLISSIPGVRAVTQDTDGSIHIESSRDIRREVTVLLVEQDYTLLQLRQRGGDLDEIYRRYFEKAGEQHDSTSAERKSGALRGVFWKKGEPKNV